MSTTATQCTHHIEGIRYGRNVVEQTRCRRKTTHPSGRCPSHRTAKDARDEVRGILEQMKANGVTIQVTMNAAGVEGPGTAAMRAIDEEARALGMTFGDEGETR